MRLEWPMEGILVGNGSNEMLGITLEGAGAAWGRGARRAALVRALRDVRAPRRWTARASLRRAPTCDCRSTSSRPRSRATRGRPVLLCSPNNPTGAAATVEEIERLLGGARCAAPPRQRLRRVLPLRLPAAARSPSRTCSSSAPSPRRGRSEACGSGTWSRIPDLVAELIKVKLPYNLNHAGVAAGLAALGGSEAAARRIRLLVAPPRRSGSRCSPSSASTCIRRRATSCW